MSWVDIVVSILSGLAVCIPLVVQLVNVVSASVKEKNWSQIVAIVLDLMKEAETLFSDGATKKAYVMASVESAAKSINYNHKIDEILIYRDRGIVILQTNADKKDLAISEIFL